MIRLGGQIVNKERQEYESFLVSQKLESPVISKMLINWFSSKLRVNDASTLFKTVL